MKVGTAARDITPPPGAELSGYLFRVQPSLGVHDPLFVRALYVESAGGGRLLWLNADVIGLTNEFVRDFRDWAARRLTLLPGQIVVSATHTHAGPATVPLTLCGDYDEAYVARLRGTFEDAAEEAVRGARPGASVVVAEGRCELGVERRKTAHPHADPRLGVVGWRAPGGEWLAVVATYAMHHVALSHHNRQASGDVAGAAARRLAEELPGRPTVLFANGAAANVNPPRSGTDFPQVKAWGQTLASAVAEALRGAALPDDDVGIDAIRTELTIPLEPLGNDRIDAIAKAAAAALPDDGSYERSRYHRAIEIWRRRMCEGAIPESVSIELHRVRLGLTELLCVNAEMFSRFGDDLRAATGRRVFVVGYANGLVGYVPPDEALDEGGYEADSAFIFYGGLPVRRGAHARIVQAAAMLINDTSGSRREAAAGRMA